MTGGRLLGATIVLGILGAAMQLAWAPRLAIFGARPDFLIVALSSLSLFSSRSQAAWMGFFFGALHGAGVGANLSQYIATRALTGFGMGWFNDLRFAPSPLTVAMTGFAATVLSSIAMLIFAPPSGIGSYLGATILSAVYNGVLVWLLYALLRRVLDPVYR